jgi:hypothetical protein
MKLIAPLLLALVAHAQNPTTPGNNPMMPRYQVISNTSKVTVQATASSDVVYFETVDIYCAAAQTLTFSQNGTAATTTTLAVTGPISPTSTAVPNAYSASNVGAGTTLKTFAIAAGQTLAFDISMFMLRPQSGGSQNLSIGTDSNTCRFQITFRQQYQ